MNARIVNIEKAIADMRAGKMIILVDDEDRENEGDLCCAAEAITPEFINFMASHGRGLICLTLTETAADHLHLNPMVTKNDSAYGTAFTVSIDAAGGISTGISARDRARTILKAVAPHAKATDFVRPGHIFPLRARDGGVLVRPGQTEGSVDLARLAGMVPAGVICEIMNDDGTMARMPELSRFAEEHDINIVTIADLIEYRIAHEKLIIRKMAEKHLPRPAGALKVAVYTSEFTPDDAYLALIKGDIRPDDDVLVGIHRECFMGDFMDSLLCDCGKKLKRAREIITAEGKGVLLYIRPKNASGAYGNNGAPPCALEAAKKRPCPTQTDKGKMELLNRAISANIFSDLGIRKIRFISDASDNEMAFEPYGVTLIENVPLS